MEQIDFLEKKFKPSGTKIGRYPYASLYTTCAVLKLFSDGKTAREVMEPLRTGGGDSPTRREQLADLLEDVEENFLRLVDHGWLELAD